MTERVCPWWLGYWLVNPLRVLVHDPRKILSPWVKEGMKVLDIGSGMGYFSLPMAELAGEKGKVLCVDLQEKMLAGLERRARKAGLSARIETRRAGHDSLMLADLAGTMDFALAFAVVHEVPDRSLFFSEIYRALKPGGKLLVAEPRGHVGPSAFEKSLDIAGRSGFQAAGRPKVRFSHTALLVK